MTLLKLLSTCYVTKPLIIKFTDFRCSDSDKYPRGDIYLSRHPMINRAYLREKEFLFSPDFEGIGADDDLLLTGISEKIIWDFRCIKFHHSLGKVLDENGNPTCGCKGHESSGKRTESQIAIHEEKIHVKTFFPSDIQILRF